MARRFSTVTPRAMVANGVARIPEDRHAEGLIGDMTITENVDLGNLSQSGPVALRPHRLAQGEDARPRTSSAPMT